MAATDCISLPAGTLAAGNKLCGKLDPATVQIGEFSPTKLTVLVQTYPVKSLRSFHMLSPAAMAQEKASNALKTPLK